MSKTKSVIFKVPFDPNIMIDDATLDEEYYGDWVAFMKYIVKEEGVLGVLDISEADITDVVDG